MTSIEPHLLKLEPYFSFVTNSLGTEDLQVFQLAGDASNRRYLRIVQDERSWVLMVWEPFVDDEKYPFLSVLNHFQHFGVQVPKVIAKSPEKGFILLEDLGDLTLERKFWESQNQELAIPYYRQALDELIKIHYNSSDRSGANKKLDCTAFHVSFDTEKLLWELNYCRKHLLETFCALSLSESESKMLDDQFHSIASRLAAEPKFITHRDYHSRNLMIKLGKMRVIDFQDARMGPIQYDLVSLIRDSYVNISEPIAQGLLEYYLLRRGEFKVPRVELEHFKMMYELQTVQRCFKACGSFASFFNMRRDTRYLKYLPKTLTTVRGSLSFFPEYKDFFNLLEDRGIFSRDYLST